MSITKHLAGMMDRFHQRITHMVGRGRLTTINDAGPVQTVQVDLGHYETRDNTPRVGEFGLASLPPGQCDAILIFIGGDRSNGVVIATNHQSSRPRNLAPGETMIYDAAGKSVYLSQNQIVIDANNTPVTINNASTVTIHATESITLDTPKLMVTGDISAGGNINDAVRSMAADRALYNAHEHGDTPPPAPQQ